MDNKNTILETISQTLIEIIDDLENIDESSKNAMKEISKLFLKEVGAKYSAQELVVDFMTPEKTSLHFKQYLNTQADIAKSMGL
ncbi:MAG: hypothetical protein PF503_10935 [Desulfobacula sp.]|jgi:hypothetical protein|nr:hypothetical protein [Desulfobacula sp.]